MNKQDCIDAATTIMHYVGYKRYCKDFIKTLAEMLNVNYEDLDAGKENLLITLHKIFPNATPVIKNHELYFCGLLIDDNLRLTKQEKSVYQYLYKKDCDFQGVKTVTTSKSILFYGKEDFLVKCLQGTKIIRIRKAKKSYHYTYDEYPIPTHGIVEDGRWLCDSLGNPNISEHSATYLNKKTHIQNPLALYNILKGYNSILLKANKLPLNIQLSIFNILGYDVITMDKLPAEIRDLINVPLPKVDTIVLKDGITYKDGNPYIPSDTDIIVNENGERCATWDDIVDYMRRNHRTLEELAYSFQYMPESDYLSTKHKIIHGCTSNNYIKKESMAPIHNVYTKLRVLYLLTKGKYNKPIIDIANELASCAASSTPKMDAISTAIYTYSRLNLNSSETEAMELVECKVNNPIVKEAHAKFIRL